MNPRDGILVALSKPRRRQRVGETVTAIQVRPQDADKYRKRGWAVCSLGGYHSHFSILVVSPPRPTPQAKRKALRK